MYLIVFFCPYRVLLVYPLTIRINYRGEIFTIGTGFKIKPTEWDFKKCVVSAKADNAINKNRFFNEVTERAQSIYDQHLKRRKELTVARLKELLTVSDSESFTEFLDKEVKRKSGSDTIGTVKGYLTTPHYVSVPKPPVTFWICIFWAVLRVCVYPIFCN